MSPSSFTIKLDEPAPQLALPPPRERDPLATTREERLNLNMMVQAILLFMGAGTALAIVYIGLSGVWYAWTFGGGPRLTIAIAVSWLSITLICAGAPVIAALTWSYRPFAARTAAVLWAVCLVSLAILDGRAAMHQQETAPAAAQPSPAKFASNETVADAQLDIDEAAAALADGDAVRQHRPFDSWEQANYVRWTERLTAAKAQMRQLAPSSSPASAPPAPARAGLDAGLLTALMLFICSTGLALSVAGLDSVYTSKIRQMMPQEPDLAIPLPALHDPSPLTRASAVTPAPTPWLWPGVIARGSYTLLGGEPGMGKSQAAIYVAAAVSTGGTWPDGSKAPRGTAVIIETEDGRDDAVVPRLHAAGANMDKVLFAPPVDLSTRMDELAKHLDAVPDLRLLVLSPFLTFFGPTSNDENTVRRKLAPMLEWAERRQVAVLGIIHVLKGGGKTDVFAGAETFRRAARAAWRLALDPDDPEPNPRRKRRLMIAAKLNNAPDALQIPYRIEGVKLPNGVESSRVVFLANNGTEVAGQNGSRIPAEEAQRWLREQLANGPVDSAIVKGAAEMDGINIMAVYRAGAAIGVLREPLNGTQRKLWSLPRTA